VAKVLHIEEQATPTFPPPAQGEGLEVASVRLVTILYSKDHDLYRVPSIDKPCWLSVKAYELPVVQLAADQIYLGGAMCANGLQWRKAYSTSWRSIIAGDRVAVPADDPIVVDYQCAVPGAISGA
jgi:hypothetical protein